MKAKYTYSADSTKLSVSDGANGYDYLGSLIYVRTNGSLSLDRALFDGGALRPNGAVDYFVKDHLGSVRVIVDQAGTVREQNDYYPYGERCPESTYAVSSVNRYKFNGKEEQTVGDLGMLDYGARMYQAGIGRWFVPDLLSENHYSISPYTYCMNNPLRFSDRLGMDTIQVIDIPSRPLDKGVKGQTYTANIYVIKNGKQFGPYKGSSYPNSISNSDNRTLFNTINEGEYLYNNLSGHKGGQQKGLNIVNEKGERKTDGTNPHGENVTMTNVNMHSGTSDNGNYNSRGSHGCITISPEDAPAFFSNFDWSGENETTGKSSGTVIIKREMERRKLKEELNK